MCGHFNELPHPSFCGRHPAASMAIVAFNLSWLRVCNQNLYPTLTIPRCNPSPPLWTRDAGSVVVGLAKRRNTLHTDKTNCLSASPRCRRRQARHWHHVRRANLYREADLYPPDIDHPIICGTKPRRAPTEYVIVLYRRLVGGPRRDVVHVGASKTPAWMLA